MLVPGNRTILLSRIISICLGSLLTHVNNLFHSRCAHDRFRFAHCHCIIALVGPRKSGLYMIIYQYRCMRMIYVGLVRCHMQYQQCFQWYSQSHSLAEVEVPPCVKCSSDLAEVEIVQSCSDSAQNLMCYVHTCGGVHKLHHGLGLPISFNLECFPIVLFWFMALIFDDFIRFSDSSLGVTFWCSCAFIQSLYFFWLESTISWMFSLLNGSVSQWLCVLQKYTKWTSSVHLHLLAVEII